MFDWTEDKIEKLISLWKSGLTGEKIAKEMGGGLSRNAVIGKANRLGLGRARQKAAKIKAKKIPQEKPRKSLPPYIPKTPIPPSYIEDNEGISISELRKGLCRAIISPHDGPTRYCGRAAKKSWCDYHTSLYEQPPKHERVR